MTDHQHLRELAQKATPGPWTLEYDSDSGEYGENYGRWPYALNGPKSTHQWITPEFIEQYSHHVTEFADMTDEDAEFIAAANPAVVLDLLTELEDTRAAAQLAQRQLDAHRAGQGTWIHEELGGHTEVIHDTAEGITQ